MKFKYYVALVAIVTGVGLQAAYLPGAWQPAGNRGRVFNPVNTTSEVKQEEGRAVFYLNSDTANGYFGSVSVIPESAFGNVEIVPGGSGKFSLNVYNPRNNQKTFATTVVLESSGLPVVGNIDPSLTTYDAKLNRANFYVNARGSNGQKEYVASVAVILESIFGMAANSVEIVPDANDSRKFSVNVYNVNGEKTFAATVLIQP